MKHLLILAFLLLSGTAAAQETHASLYDPKADAAADIRHAVERAAREGKHVLVQVGGDWCTWCHRLEKLLTTDDTLRGIIEASYVRIHVNYSKENQNLPVLAALGYPQRFGFPVLVVLDPHGVRLHTQDSGLLESGKGHDPEKVRTFLEKWTPKALDPARYTPSHTR